MENSAAQQLLSQAYDEHADAIFRHCYFKVHDRELAKDLMQQVFLKCWQYLECGKQIEQMRAFLYQTANNTVIDHVRKHKKHVAKSLEEMQEAQGFDPASTESTTAEAEAHYTEAAVHNVLANIKEPYRTAVMLRYIDELSPAEIAETLKISVSNASARISRGLHMLRSLVSPNG